MRPPFAALGALVAQLPNPFEAVGDAVNGAAGSLASKAAESTYEFFMKRLGEALANAARKVLTEMLHYLDKSSGVSLDQGWFAGPRAREIVSSVALFAAVLMVLFILAAVIQGLLNGDIMMMVRPAVIEAPISVFAIVALTSITAALLAVTDSASSMVLATVPDSLERFSHFTTAADFMTQGVLGLAMAVVFIVGAVLVWIELVVRSALLYLLLAFAPLVLAARVWPVLRGAWHQLCRFGVALIVSKFAIALALGLGSAALAGGGPDALAMPSSSSADVGAQAGLSVGALVVGAALMLLAAFAPFVILKLLPVFEAAVLAQGIGRGPMRATQTAMQMGYYGKGLSRLGGAGGGGSPGTGSGGGGPGAAGGPGGGGGGTAPAAPGPAAGAGGTGAAAGATGAGGAAAGGGAGAAAAGPAAAAMVPLAVASKARSTAAQAAEAKSAAPEGGPAS